MTAKRKIQIGLDMAMTILLPLLMAYELIGEATHEWIGISMFILFVFHHILNWRWHRNLTKGRYSGQRILGTAVNALLLIIMISLMASGIMMSKHAFVFLPINTGTSFARTMHMLASYWGFVLMSVHLGLHWNMLMGMAKRLTSGKKAVGACSVFLKIIAVMIAVYGGYAFHVRQIGDYMLLLTQFVFFDFSEPVIMFLLDYLAIMGLFGCVGHYLSKGLHYLDAKYNRRRER